MDPQVDSKEDTRRRKTSVMQRQRKVLHFVHRLHNRREEEEVGERCPTAQIQRR